MTVRTNHRNGPQTTNSQTGVPIQGCDTTLHSSQSRKNIRAIEIKPATPARRKATLQKQKP